MPEMIAQVLEQVPMGCMGDPERDIGGVAAFLAGDDSRYLTGNTLFYNLTLASSMFVGRFFMIIPAMALAGSLAAKKSIPPSAGTLPTNGGLFVGLVVGVILIIGGLTFFPALALGPIAEHLAMNANTLF